MTRRLIIHSGLAHTGTSAIQHFCSINRECLLDKGFLFPTAGMNPGGNHIHLVRAIVGQVVGSAHQECLDDFRKEVRAHPAKTVLISSEYVGNRLLSVTDRERLLSFFGDEDFDIELIFFLRDVPAWINGGYAQRVKSFSITMDYADFATHAVARLKSILDQLLKIRSYGTTKVSFFAYTDAVRRAGVAKHFLSKIGLSSVDLAELGPEARVNVSIGPIAVAAAWQALANLRCRSVTLTELQRRKLGRRLLKRLEDLAPEPAFQGMDESLHSRVQSASAGFCSAFAMAVWGREWVDVLPPGAFRTCNRVDPTTTTDGALERIRSLAETLNRDADRILRMWPA